MKKIFLLVIAIIAFSSSSFAQNKANIKTVSDRFIDIDPLPFFRTKYFKYGFEKKGERRADGSIAEKNTYGGAVYRRDNYSGLPFYGYTDLNNSEFTVSKKEKIKLPPNVFGSNRKFQSSKNNYCLLPFFITAGTLYWEDILVSCDKITGDVADVLFVGQAGGADKDLTHYLHVRQWSINERGEITVYRLELTTTEKIYFVDCPEVINLKRTDTVYQINDKGKFYQISKKEYKPKNYKREELFQESKNIWEGNEVAI